MLNKSARQVPRALSFWQNFEILGVSDFLYQELVV